jgi:V8-like Glu-specific endopeptidase
MPNQIPQQTRNKIFRFGIALLCATLIAVTFSSALASDIRPEPAPARPDTRAIKGPVDDDRGIARSLDTSPELEREPSEAERAEFEQIFYPDERARISPTTEFPSSAIAHIEMYVGDSRTGTCTGTFVSPNAVLTAGHCLYTRETGWADRIAIIPGRDGQVEPFGYAWAEDMWVPRTWVNTLDTYWDWGILRLPDRTLGDEVGWFEIGVLQTSTLESDDFKPVITGYPSDKQYGTMWTGSQSAFDGVSPAHLTYLIDTFAGQSGAAIRRDRDNVVVGIHIGSVSGTNIGTRIDEEMLDDILTGCADLDCELSYFIEEQPRLPAPTLDPIPTPPDTLIPPGHPGNVEPIGTPHYEETWNRTDGPVADGHISRTWMWGPSPFTSVIEEPYLESPDGRRGVQYFDKSRMEITNPDGDVESIWYVTNGLLVLELVTGARQVGDDTYQHHSPAEIPIAGDIANLNGPTYASFAHLIGSNTQSVGDVILHRVDRAGMVTSDPAYGMFDVRSAYHIDETGHTIAEPFWAFMNSSGPVYQDGALTSGSLFQSPFYATGLPITEAYWTTVEINGESKIVLVQLFERRILTYTPDNPDGWQVEAGNVGTHYFMWRYMLEPDMAS